MGESFKPSAIVNDWISILNLDKNSNLLNPTGFGSSNGLNFMTNHYKPFIIPGSSNNLILSITNEHNSFDVYKENFIIQPGYSYNFKIVANQISTTDRFNSLDIKDRGCVLPSDKFDLNLMNQYSQSGCEYECAIKNVSHKCKCSPWNIPKQAEDNLQFCYNENDFECFDVELEKFSPAQCICPADCAKTSFSIFDSKTPLERPGKDCSFSCNTITRQDYPFKLFCKLCKKMIHQYQIRFVYDYIVRNESDPKNLVSFCNKFLTENVALVKVEMATKSLTRAVKDQRFNFVSKVSSLGELVS
jgi:hypothetical protein